MLDDFCFVDNFDGKDVFGNLVPHLVDFTKTTYANVRVCEGFKIILSALPFLP